MDKQRFGWFGFMPRRPKGNDDEPCRDLHLTRVRPLTTRAMPDGGLDASLPNFHSSDPFVRGFPSKISQGAIPHVRAR
jgi:hypothetical protein